MTQGAVGPLYRLQIGKEVTWGTEVAATARLIGGGRLLDMAEVVRPENDYGVLVRAVEAPVLVADGAGFDFSTNLSFEQILHVLLASVKGGVTPVEQTVGEGDYLWTFASPVSSDPAVDSFTLEAVAPDGSGNIEQFTATGGIVEEFGISAAFGANLSEMTAKWVCKDLTAKAPTADPGRPTRTLIPADKWTIKIADTQAGLAGASALSGVVGTFDLSIKGGSRLARRLSGATTPAAKKFGPYEGTVTLSSDLIAAIETERTNFRAGTRRFLRIAVEGAQIGAGTNYRIQIDICADILQPPSAGDEDGQETRELTYAIAHDPTWGYGFEFQVTNALSALP